VLHAVSPRARNKSGGARHKQADDCGERYASNTKGRQDKFRLNNDRNRSRARYLREQTIISTSDKVVQGNSGFSLRFELPIRQLVLGLTKKHNFISPNDDRKRGSSGNKLSQ
jgi:hypothetical protein